MQCDGDDMVAGDSNGAYDIFVKDLQTGSLTLVSRLPNGAQGNSYSFGTFRTSDGSKVAFSSVSTNLAAPDTNAVGDAFVANRQ
jgi:Tol biopolymer transport system component